MPGKVRVGKDVGARGHGRKAAKQVVGECDRCLTQRRRAAESVACRAAEGVVGARERRAVLHLVGDKAFDGIRVEVRRHSVGDSRDQVAAAVVCAGYRRRSVGVRRRDEVPRAVQGSLVSPSRRNTKRHIIISFPIAQSPLVQFFPYAVPVEFAACFFPNT